MAEAQVRGLAPLRAAMVAACDYMGVTLESWCSPGELGRADPEALMDILPPKARLIARWVYDRALADGSAATMNGDSGMNA